MGIVGSGPGDREAMTKAYVLAFFLFVKKLQMNRRQKGKRQAFCGKK